MANVLTAQQLQLAQEHLAASGKLIIDKEDVADLLREMDFTQKQADEDGTGDVAWYHYASSLCRKLGIDYADVNADKELKRVNDEDFDY